MKVLHLYLADSIMQLIREFLREEGYTVTVTRQAAEALRIIEEGVDRDGHYVFIADNFTLNRESVEALKMLHDRPEARQRTRIIGITAMAGQGPIEWVSGGMIDEFMRMPFTPAQLIDRVEANAAVLTES